MAPLENGRDRLQAGFARRPLDAPEGLPMDGYAARRGPSTGTLDPLAARVCVVTGGERSIALVALDVLGIGGAFLSAVERSVSASHPDITLLLAATHTHAAPAGFAAVPGDRATRRFRDSVVDSIVDGVREARAAASVADVIAAQRRIEGVAAHRHVPDIRVDKRLRIVAFVAPGTGELMGVVATFACHPTVLPSSNRLYSADLHGNAASLAESRLGTPCLLFNGAEGEVSTRFTRRNQTPGELERLSGILARSVVSGARGAAALGRAAKPPPDGRLTVAVRAVELPVRPSPPRRDAENSLARARQELGRMQLEHEPAAVVRRASTRVEGAEAQLARARAGLEDQGAVRVTLWGVRIDRAILVTVPGELFNTAVGGHRLLRRGDLHIVGLANGYAGYFPTRDAFEGQTYEALSSRFAPEGTDRIVETLAALARDVGTAGASPRNGIQDDDMH